jgi:hypothetical protein
MVGSLMDNEFEGDGRKQSWLTKRYYLDICLNEPRKISVNQDSWSLDQDSIHKRTLLNLSVFAP